jgi:hypothetical protein
MKARLKVLFINFKYEDPLPANYLLSIDFHKIKDKFDLIKK